MEVIERRRAKKLRYTRLPQVVVQRHRHITRISQHIDDLRISHTFEEQMVHLFWSAVMTFECPWTEEEEEKEEMIYFKMKDIKIDICPINK